MTETAAALPTTIDESEHLDGYRVVHRMIARADQELDIRPLYVGGVSSMSAGSGGSRQSGAAEDEPAGAQSSTDDQAGPEQALSAFGRIGAKGVIAKPERRVTFGTYFNAFPASYWRRWTPVESVRLVMRVWGDGAVTVYRSTAKGFVQRAESVTIDGSDVQTIVFDLPLKPFIDGGWYWFDLEAAESELGVVDAVWAVETDQLTPGKVAIGITTFNRPDFCVDQLLELGSQPTVMDVLDEIIVVDQGTQKVSEHEDFERAASALGSKLRIIDQGNLGGSGGFSRAMMETAEKSAADYVLLLDDDVVCEPEGILRAVAFADLAKRPTIVGGQMFSLYARSVMHAYGEAIAKYRWFWGPAPNTFHGHDFAVKPLRSTKWLHRRVDVDYNGWWMCLIPTDVVRKIGLALPMFIKWDDAEYGLRASEAGFPTVTLPGVAVWHVPWHEKDDTVDWQAYFHNRNRLISGLLHSPYERGGSLLRELFLTHLKHSLSMQYSTAEMCLLALEDVLEGPDRMHRDVMSRLGELRTLRQEFIDATPKPDLDAFPPPRQKRPPRHGKSPQEPTVAITKLMTLAKAAARQVRPVRDLAQTHPEATVPHIDQKWWLLSQLDSALVSAADGSAAFWYRRDPAKFRDLMRRSTAIHARLVKEWPDLAQRYKDALPELTAPDQWRRTFDQSTSKDS